MDTKTIFGKPVDLEKYNNLTPQTYKGYKFLKYSWLNINDKYKNDIYHDDLSNVGVRAALHSERDIENFAYKLKRKGIDTTKHPLPYDISLDVPMGGRKRITSFIINKEEIIPIAEYESIKKSLRALVSGGLQENQKHDGSDDNEFADYITTAKLLIQNNQLKKEKSDVETWLYDDVGITDFYHKKTVNKLVETILSLDDNGMELMRCVDRKEAESYCKKYLAKLKEGDDNFGLDFDKDCLLMSPSEVNTYRIFGHLVENAELDKKTNVFWYGTKLNPSIVTSSLELYQKELDEQYIGGLSNLINKSLPDNWPENLKFSKPFKTDLLNVIGCIPQKVGVSKHETKYKANDIISVEEY